MLPCICLLLSVCVSVCVCVCEYSIMPPTGAHTQQHLHCVSLFTNFRENTCSLTGLTGRCVVICLVATKPKTVYLKLGTQALVQLPFPYIPSPSLDSASISTCRTANCFLASPTFPGCQRASSLPSRPQSDSKLTAPVKTDISGTSKTGKKRRNN